VNKIRHARAQQNSIEIQIQLIVIRCYDSAKLLTSTIIKITISIKNFLMTTYYSNITLKLFILTVKFCHRVHLGRCPQRRMDGIFNVSLYVLKRLKFQVNT